MLTVDPAIAAHRRHYPSVSLLVPIDGPTPWPARLRRLQREANLRLLAEFDGHPDGRLLAHLDDAVVNAEAPHGARSLAVYASSEGCDWVGLAVHVRERVVVDDTFATRDLVHHDLRSPRYWVLALSLDHPRLLRGHGGRLHPQTLPLRDTVEHPSTSRDHRRGDRSDAIEARRTRRLRALDMAISEAVGDDADPLVVVGVEPTLSRFLARTGHIARVEGVVRRAADPSLTALAATVAPSVAEMLTERRVAALHQLDQAVGAGRASSGLDQAWRHARRERGALLLVEEHFEVPARLRADRTLQRADDPDAPDVIDDAVDELIEIVLSRQGYGHSVARYRRAVGRMAADVWDHFDGHRATALDLAAWHAAGRADRVVVVAPDGSASDTRMGADVMGVIRRAAGRADGGPIHPAAVDGPVFVATVNAASARELCVAAGLEIGEPPLGSVIAAVTGETPPGFVGLSVAELAAGLDVAAADSATRSTES